MVDNKRHGKGTIFVKHGKKLARTYVGEWANGQMEGFGVYYCPNGEIYRGDWKTKDQVRTSGHKEWKYYDGEWASDKKNASESFFWPMGTLTRDYGWRHERRPENFSMLQQEKCMRENGRRISLDVRVSPTECR